MQKQDLPNEMRCGEMWLETEEIQSSSYSDTCFAIIFSPWMNDRIVGQGGGMVVSLGGGNILYLQDTLNK